jgi:hypothetical protein
VGIHTTQKEGFFVKKFKKVVTLSLALAMGLSLVACGGGDTTTEATTSGDSTEATSEDASADDASSEDTEATSEEAAAEKPDIANDGKVLNISCWNEEFKSRLEDHYPGYEKVDATHGKIGDIDVVFTITPSDDNAYQNNLDANLPDNASKPADERIDLFLVEADYALKYVDEDVTLPVTDLGIEMSELDNQYGYTKDVMTSSDGKLKGVSWQGCPGTLIYNREIAKDVWGTDDPAEVGAKLDSWDKYYAAAAEVQAKGYLMQSTTNDSFRVYSNNATKLWVDDSLNLQIDDGIMEWVDKSKAMVDAKQTTTNDLWSDDWNKGMYPDGKTFCYFGPAWLINFCMHADDEASVAAKGGWGACEGPKGFYWGGTWIAAANGTDNPALVADIIRKLTTDETIMTDIVKKDNDFVNNKPAMEKLAADDSFAFDVFGGQNPLGMYAAGADKIVLKQSAYDQGCNEEFQKAMKNYFDGNATKEEALSQFYKAVKEKYPELNVPE